METRYYGGILDGKSFCMISLINVYCALEASSSPREPHGIAVCARKMPSESKPLGTTFSLFKFQNGSNTGPKMNPAKWIQMNGFGTISINEEPNGQKSAVGWSHHQVLWASAPSQTSLPQRAQLLSGSYAKDRKRIESKCIHALSVIGNSLSIRIAGPGSR